MEVFMKDISKRIKALFFLRAIFLICIIAGFGSFLVEGISLSFGDGHAFSESGAMTLIVFTGIFTGLRLLAIVLSAVTFILTMKINKECMAAFLTIIGAAVFAIAAGVLIYTQGTAQAGFSLELVSGIATAVSVFLLIDGIFDQQARPSPLFKFAMLGVCLMVVASVISFIVYFIRTPEALLGAVYSAGQVTYIISTIIIFLAIHLCLKEIKNNQESEVIEQ